MKKSKQTKKPQLICDIKVAALIFPLQRTFFFSSFMTFFIHWYIFEEKTSGKNHLVIVSTSDLISGFKGILLAIHPLHPLSFFFFGLFPRHAFT